MTDSIADEELETILTFSQPRSTRDRDLYIAGAVLLAAITIACSTIYTNRVTQRIRRDVLLPNTFIMDDSLYCNRYTIVTDTGYKPVKSAASICTVLK